MNIRGCLKDLINQKQNIVNILNSQGFSATKDEKLNTLMPKLKECVKQGVSENIANNIFGNVIRQNVDGETIAVNDASSIEHTLDVNVRSKNILDFNKFSSTQTINGITFTNNNDGTITLNGTATANAVYACINASNTLPIKAGTYTLSGGLSASIWVQGKVKEDDSISLYNAGTKATYTFNNDYSFRFNIRVSSGTVCDNVVIYPQLELGSTATDYTPYVPDLSAVSVSRYGKNLFTTENRTIRTLSSVGGVSATFTENSIYIGVARNAYYVPTNITNYDISNPKKITCTSIQTAYGIGLNFKVKAGETYVVSHTNYDSTKHIVGVGFYKEDGSLISHSTKTLPLDFTIPDGTYWLLVVLTGYSSTDNPIEWVFENVQLELASTATDYEEYKEPTTYTVAANGTTSGITSIAPTMTITTNTIGTIIDCKYNTDTQTYIDNKNLALQTAILEAGGS